MKFLANPIVTKALLAELQWLLLIPWNRFIPSNWNNSCGFVCLLVIVFKAWKNIEKKKDKQMIKQEYHSSACYLQDIKMN